MVSWPGLAMSLAADKRLRHDKPGATTCDHNTFMKVWPAR